MFFTLKVLHAAIDIAVDFYGMMKFSADHESVTVNYHVLIIQDTITSTCILIDKLLQHV